MIPPRRRGRSAVGPTVPTRCLKPPHDAPETECAARYTIRYRSTEQWGRTRLIVEDDHGAIYLFGDGWLQHRLAGAGPRGHQVRRLAPGGRWTAVPEVSPYTLDELRRLTAAPQAGGAGAGSQNQRWM